MPKKEEKKNRDIWSYFVSVAVSVADWVMIDDGWFQEGCRLSVLLYVLLDRFRQFY